MPRVSNAFFVLAVLCGLAGMGWGIHMGVGENHQTVRAPARLYLFGSVSCSLMGGFQALAGEQAAARLASIDL